MSVSMYMWTERCENSQCVGDCDLCRFAEEDEEEE